LILYDESWLTNVFVFITDKLCMSNRTKHRNGGNI